MIFDKLENAQIYYALNNNFKTAFEFLKNTDLKNQECGQYTINEDIFYNLQEYNTKEIAPFEAHREHIDIQFVIKGEEKMGFSHLENFTPSSEYNKEKDVIFGEIKNSSESFVVVQEGFFTIFTPEDAHAPALSINCAQTVKKVIIKIKR